MSTRTTNEKRYKEWVTTADGGRIYTRKVEGQYGWHALYIKQVDAHEKIISFRQEIYNEQMELIEIHEKFPIEKGYQKIKK
jgi:hypothetical protein